MRIYQTWSSSVYKCASASSAFTRKFYINVYMQKFWHVEYGGGSPSEWHIQKVYPTRWSWCHPGTPSRGQRRVAMITALGTRVDARRTTQVNCCNISPHLYRPILSLVFCILFFLSEPEIYFRSSPNELGKLISFIGTETFWRHIVMNLAAYLLAFRFNIAKLKCR